jgi:hypothetical protein
VVATQGARKAGGKVRTATTKAAGSLAMPAGYVEHGSGLIVPDTPTGRVDPHRTT